MTGVVVVLGINFGVPLPMDCGVPPHPHVGVN